MMLWSKLLHLEHPTIDHWLILGGNTINGYIAPFIGEKMCMFNYLKD